MKARNWPSLVASKSTYVKSFGGLRVDMATMVATTCNDMSQNMTSLNVRMNESFSCLEEHV